MRKLLVTLGLMLFLLPAAAHAQRAEAFGGYSYARLNPGGLAGNEINLNGWHGALQVNPSNWFGLVGDFSGHYGRRGTGLNNHLALFGPRVMLPAGPLRPFAHSLFGVARGNAGLFGSTESDSAFGMALGGGLDVGGGTVVWRLAQVDYLMTRFSARRQDNVRISTGLVIRF